MRATTITREWFRDEPLIFMIREVHLHTIVAMDL